MDNNTKQIVSMIAGDDKITLITSVGDLIDIENGNLYDTERIVEHLTVKLTGMNEVEINLDEYLILNEALFPEGFEDKGDIIVRVVNGKQIKGMFFPLKVEVSVKVEGKEVVIPEAEKLTTQMSRAVDQNSPAVANFMRRIAKVAAERRHSAEDLMKFISHCDLPLTDAGEIIAYKRVNKRENGFVDCHSGTVLQDVGYRVFTDVEKVDPDRSRACSNGLHVGSLQFMKSFYGGETIICLVKPEDFIAVPTYDEKKCRVCSYDIIGVLSKEDRNAVNSGKFIENSKFNLLIGNAVAGNTPKMTHKTYVRGIGDTVTTKFNEDPKKVKPVSDAQIEAKGQSLEKDEKKAKGTKVLDKAKRAKSATISELALQMLKNKSWVELLAFKKLKKKSWSALGITEEEGQKVVKKASEPVPPPKPVAPLTNKDLARGMFIRKEWSELKEFKSHKKKSWQSFGFSNDEIKKIKKNT